MRCSSRPTRSVRSTTGSPVTTSQSNVATASTATSARRGARERAPWPVSPSSPPPCGASGALLRALDEARAGGGAGCSGVSAPFDAAVEHERDACPVSSDTTRATASFSSVTPSAARCREPSSRARRGLTLSGRKQAAAAMRSPCTMAAPSCSGEVGWKMTDDEIVGERGRRAECRSRCGCAGRCRARRRPARRFACRQRLERHDELLDRVLVGLDAAQVLEERARPKCTRARRMSVCSSTIAAKTT